MLRPVVSTTGKRPEEGKRTFFLNPEILGLIQLHNTAKFLGVSDHKSTNRVGNGISFRKNSAE
jgi:hypothetical protein